MAKVAQRTKTSFGILDSYVNDAAYVAAHPSYKRGDFYFNSTESRFRYYNGISWSPIGSTSQVVVSAADFSLVAVPSGPQTIDGYSAVVGDFILLGNPALNSIYEVKAGVWEQKTIWQSPTPSYGDQVYTVFGSTFGNTLFVWGQGPDWHIINITKKGTTQYATAVWDGANYWVENPFLLIDGNLVYRPDDTINNGAQAGGLYIHASNKTAGTGNGGDLSLAAGTSVGGISGRVTIEGNTIQLNAQNASDPVAGLGSDVYYNTASNNFKYFDNAVWRHILPLPLGSVNNSTLHWNGFYWVENASLLTNSSQVLVPNDVNNDALPAANLSLTASNKTAGTGAGGDVVISSGTSVGGLAGITNITSRKVRLNTQAPIDPVDGVTTDIYYNSTEKRFKYFDGTVWRPFGSGGIAKVDLYDPISTTLTTGSPVVIDGVTVTNGQIVLFSNLLSGNNKAYQATVTGLNVTAWTPQILFGPSDTPTQGDTALVSFGTAFALQLGKFTGSTWVFNDKVRYFNGTDYLEQSSLYTSTITNNTAGAVVTSFNFLGSENVIFEYSIYRGTSKETGQLLITTNGTLVNYANSSSFVGATGVTLSADLSGALLRVLYTADNSGSNGTCKFSIRRWSNTAGGPAGPPSYTGVGGGGSVTSSGGPASGQIAIFTSGTDITGNANFQIDTGLQALKLGSLEVLALNSVAFNDNQIVPAVLLTFPASYKHAVLEYGVVRAGIYRTGRLLISNDGAITGHGDDYTETAVTGISFTSDVSGGNVRVLYTTTPTGSGGTFKWSARRWA